MRIEAMVGEKKIEISMRQKNGKCEKKRSKNLKKYEIVLRDR